MNMIAVGGLHIGQSNCFNFYAIFKDQKKSFVGFWFVGLLVCWFFLSFLYY
jgi:hypothetical protein